MDKKEFKALKKEARKAHIYNNTKHFLTDKQRPTTLMEARRQRITEKIFSELFGSLNKLYKQCGIPPSRRENGIIFFHHCPVLFY